MRIAKTNLQNKANLLLHRRDREDLVDELENLCGFVCSRLKMAQKRSKIVKNLQKAT
jgi:hypothetical protein